MLAAVDACPGGSLWVLGDPRQSQPVGAGGIADHLDRLATDGLIPAARLTVNRRQVDVADREALEVLRRGYLARSQQLRAEHGWEHEHPSPGETREAMADGVFADIDRYGPGQVAVLVVSHGDAEDLADRVRARLAVSGALSGVVMTGPGGPVIGTTRPGIGCCCTPAAAGRPAGGQRDHRYCQPRRRRRAHRHPGWRGDRAAGGGLRPGHPQGRQPQPLARLGSHRRRRPGRHLGDLPPSRQRRSRRLPGLHRPVPLSTAHPHLEYHPGGRRGPRRHPRRPACWRRAGRRRPGPSARSFTGCSQRPVDSRPAAAPADRPA